MHCYYFKAVDVAGVDKAPAGHEEILNILIPKNFQFQQTIYLYIFIFYFFFQEDLVITFFFIPILAS